ncbi:MAG: hypothetical protein Q6362_002930 [Candidatus Wukongarchaeota archaeon]|nr:hypothetical protein [Candidatus Wukongarchaeota archaeon]
MNQKELLDKLEELEWEDFEVRNGENITSDFQIGSALWVSR